MKENGRALLGSARVGQALFAAFDDFFCVLDEVFGQGNTHALTGGRVYIQVQLFHGFNGHIGGAGTFQNAHYHGAGLAAVVVVVEAKSGDRATLNGGGVCREYRNLGAFANGNNGFGGTDYGVVSGQVDSVYLADQRAGRTQNLRFWWLRL